MSFYHMKLFSNELYRLVDNNNWNGTRDKWNLNVFAEKKEEKTERETEVQKT